MTRQETSDLKIAPHYRVKVYDTLDSTSLEAKRLARKGVSAGLWVLADQQTGGKGRHGRTWSSLPGNLFASLLLFPACDISKNMELSFVSAVAVAATLRHFCKEEITCKWPNDVLIQGQKVAGILLETESTGNPQKPWVVIGIGLNICTKPENVEFSSTCLNDYLKEPVNRNSVFEILTIKMSEAVTRWAKDGFGPIRTLWLNQAHNRGRKIKIENAGEILEGSFEGLSKTGALLLKDNQGNLSEIISGTVIEKT